MSSTEFNQDDIRGGWDAEIKQWFAYFEDDPSIMAVGTTVKEAWDNAKALLDSVIEREWRQVQYDNDPLSFEGDAMWVSEDDDSSKY